jgi:hypothetical protein
MEEERSARALEAFAKFTEVISDRDRRKRFLNEPEGAFKEVGGDIGHLPDEVRGFLRGLSEDELELLSRFNREMVLAGLSTRTKGGATVSWL